MPVVNVSDRPIDGTAAADHDISHTLLTRVAAGELDAALRIWSPVPALATSRLAERRPGAAAARTAAAAAGFPSVRRLSGGHAVVLGPGSLCVGYAEPAARFAGTTERYERLGGAITAALHELGIDAQPGDVADEWCPGTWSIHAGGVKLAGLAQRAIKDAAWIEAVVERAPDPAARALLAEVYAALELPLDPATLGSVAELTGAEVPARDLAERLANRCLSAFGLSR